MPPSGSGGYELKFYQVVEVPAKLHYAITLLFSSGASKDLQLKMTLKNPLLSKVHSLVSKIEKMECPKSQNIFEFRSAASLSKFPNIK